MTRNCNRSFDEANLSGYLDLALPQGEHQQVRVHLEDCAQCRALVEEMKLLRETTMETSFRIPSDDSWNEAPRGNWSPWLFRFGWVIVLLSAVGVAGLSLWGSWTQRGDALVELMPFGFLIGFGLLALSVVLDRVKTYGTDRYRKVKK